MTISSSFSSGLSGLQRAQSNLTRASLDLASPAKEDADHTRALVTAQETLHQGEASAKVLSVSVSLLGNLINIKV